MTSLRDVSTAALRWRRLPVAVGAGLFSLVLVWTLLVTPRYRSAALLQVHDAARAGAITELLSDLPGADLLGGLGKDGLETQVGVLRSRRVLDAVFDSLGLDVTVREPEADGTPVVAVHSARVVGREYEGQVTLLADGDGWQVRVDEMEPALTLPARVAAGDTIVIGHHRIVPAADLAARGIARLVLRVAPRYETRRLVERRLDVRRQATRADLIAVTYDDPDPLRAKAVVERMLAEYLDFATRAARGDAGTTVAELRRQISQQEQRMAAAEEALRRYQERTGLVIPDEQGAAQVKRYAALRGTLDQLEVERAALARVIALVEGKAAAAGEATAAYRQLATFPTLIENRAIQDLLQALLTLENDRAALRLVRSDANADVRQLTSRIAEIEAELLRISRQYLESLGEQLVPTRGAIAEIDRELNALPERELQFLRLYRERTILNEGYVALQQQLRLTEVQDALRLDDIRVVDAPEQSNADDPYFPRVPVHLAIALVLALAGGGAVALAQSSLSSASRAT